MKITLIHPKWQKGLWSVKILRLPPMGLAQIAAVTPDDIEMEIIDENIENLRFEKTDVVGISAMTSTVYRAYEIADRYREMGSKVILGGIHPSVMPEEAIQHADSVVIGEADEIWPRVVQDCVKNRLQNFYIPDRKPDLSRIPLPRTDLIRKKHKYISGNVVQTSRGCPMNCDFCSVSAFNGTRVRHKPIENVIREVERAEGLWKRRIYFADDNIVADPGYSKELFKALKPLKIKWAGQASIVLAKNKELLQLAVESGCITVFTGFESLSQDALSEVHKSSRYRAEEYEEVINLLHSCGIMVVASFIFGFDNDNSDVFKRTVDFCYKTNIQVAQFSVLTPFPGTALHERFDREGRITKSDKRLYDAFHTVIQPNRMSPEELQSGVEDAYKKFYSLKSSIKRIGHLLPHLGPCRIPLHIALIGFTNYSFHQFGI